MTAAASAPVSDAVPAGRDRVIEEIALGYASTSGIVATLQLGACPLLLEAPEAIRASALADLVEAGKFVSFARSERGGGSDPARMKTVATREDGGWRVRGEKCGPPAGRRSGSARPCASSWRCATATSRCSRTPSARG